MFGIKIRLGKIHLPHIDLPKIHLPHVNLAQVWRHVTQTAAHVVHQVEHSVSHAAHQVGREVSSVVHKAEHGLAGVGRKIEHGLSALGHQIEHAAHDVAHTVSDAVHKLGHEGIQALHKVAQFAKAAGHQIEHTLNALSLEFGELALHLRPLHPEEERVARKVFGNTLPPGDRILIAPFTGKDDRPFTIPGTFLMASTEALGLFIPGIPHVLFAAELLAQVQNKYIIFLGKEGYQDALHLSRDYGTVGETFVHELTHVWQGHNSAFSWDYVFKSIKDQCQIGQHAYDYSVEPPQPWDSYRVEGQAHLVEDWWSLGANETPTDERYPYIRDNIRKGRPHGATHFGTAASGLRSGARLQPAGAR